MSVASIPELNSVSDIATAVTQSRDTFASGETKDYEWRVEQLKQVIRMTNEQQDKLVAALHADLGKCKTEAWTSEIGFIIGDAEHTIKHLKKWMKPRKVSTPIAAQPGKSYQLAEPLGTVLIIGAWNYPFQLVFAPLIAAIAAGNCAVVKPSELAPETSKLIAKMVPEYLDTNAITVVEGAVDETTELLKQHFDHIFAWAIFRLFSLVELLINHVCWRGCFSPALNVQRKNGCRHSRHSVVTPIKHVPSRD